MKRLSLAVLFLVAFLGIEQAQVNVSISDTTYSSNLDTVRVPITAKNYVNIGAISLDILYDTAAVHFLDVENKITHGSFVPSNGSGGHIKVGWFDTNPLNLSSGVLFNLVFTNVKSSTSFQFFTSNCEIADTSVNVLTVNYKNGSLTQLILPATLSGNVWYDANGNGIKDQGEAGLRWGVWIDLFTGSGLWKKGTLTDSVGNFKFNNLTPGSYYVVAYLIGGYSGYKFTSEYAGADSTRNSRVKQVTDTSGKSDVINLESSEVYSWMNIGTVQKVTGITQESGSTSMHYDFALLQNYPNPFNPSTTIEFTLPKTEKVMLSLFNILGQKVTTLLDAEISAGNHSITFNAGNLPSGIYIYQLTGGNVSIIKKMILMK